MNLNRMNLNKMAHRFYLLGVFDFAGVGHSEWERQDELRRFLENLNAGAIRLEKNCFFVGGDVYRLTTQDMYEYHAWMDRQDFAVILRNSLVQVGEYYIS